MTDKTKAELQEECKVLKEENKNLKDANRSLGQSFNQAKTLSDGQAKELKKLGKEVEDLKKENEKLAKALKNKPVKEVSTRPGRSGVYGKELG